MSQELTNCAECGMPVAANEYHPFAACLMFKACHNSDTVRANLAAVMERAQPAGEAVETAQSIAADCYHWIADRIGTRDGYSVQDHIDAMCNVLDECADYFHDFPENAVAGDDAAVRIAANLRALKVGKLEDADDAAPQKE